VAAPHGPKPIADNGQVVIPRSLLEAVGLRPGQSVYFVENDAQAGTILVVPEALGEKWFQKGRRLVTQSKSRGKRKT
jgi:bifunctional DNA-binding transcriptional regulator/antitoxin component of YhaV-PrlF toxin-antitoxin module